MDPDPATLDVDARFLLANERTLLAWLRTALTLQAGGVGVLQFATSLRVRALAGVALVLLGALAAAVGLVRYRAADRALRRGGLPPTGRAPQLLTAAVVALAVALVVAYLVAEPP